MVIPAREQGSVIIHIFPLGFRGDISPLHLSCPKWGFTHLLYGVYCSILEWDLVKQKPWLIPALLSPAVPNSDPQRCPLPQIHDRISASNTTKEHWWFSSFTPAQILWVFVQSKGTSGMHLQRRRPTPSWSWFCRWEWKGLFPRLNQWEEASEKNLSWNGNAKLLVMASFRYTLAPFFSLGKNKY